MKILSINTYAGKDVGGGTERTLYTLQSALQDRGHEVLRASTAQGWRSRVEDVAGIKTYSVPIANLYWPVPERRRNMASRMAWHIIDLYNPVMRWQLTHLLDLERPNVVTIHNLPGWSVSALDAIHQRKIPMIQVLHDHYNVCVNSQMRKGDKNCTTQCAGCKILRAPHRSLTNQIDAVVGVSQYILDRHLACGAYLDVPIKKVIHNVRSKDALALDEAPKLRADARANRKNDGIRFGYIGLLAPFKGLDLLLDTFSALNDDRAELWIAGRGIPEYVNMLKERYRNPKITFLGHTAPKTFFTAVDVTIVPSLWQENYPGVISESFAFGVPVIGSCRGGIPEMITRNENGFVFEPDTSGELLIFLKYFIDHPEEARQMGDRALAASSRFLDVETWISSYEEILSGLANGSAVTKSD